jgi:hypothetical protein
MVAKRSRAFACSRATARSKEAPSLHATLSFACESDPFDRTAQTDLGSSIGEEAAMADYAGIGVPLESVREGAGV